MAASPALAHSPGCRTSNCDSRAYQLWLKHHPFRFPAFALCVANRESGEPGSYSYSTINWRFDAEGYEGAYDWVNSTWLAMGGGRYAEHAYDATPEQQTRVFLAHANSHDWPLTVPACE